MNRPTRLTSSAWIKWIEIGITEVYRAVQLWQRWESNVMPTGYGTGHDLMTVPQWMMNRLQYP